MTDQSTDSVDRLARPTPTYVEQSTNGLTESLLPTADILTFRNARENGRDSALPVEEILPELADTIRAGAERLTTRRTGKRSEIDPDVRTAIYRRDGWACTNCGEQYLRGAFLVLDHITPWIAGGSDHSENLRTLCDFCNERRSNSSWNATATRYLPVTLACSECSWLEYRSDGIAAYCGGCRQVTRVPDIGWCA